MKFELIAVGDTVFIQKELRAGFSQPERFWIPVKAEKVTAKQFVAGGKRYRKEDGHQIGGDSYMSSCRGLGENCGYQRDVTDQTKEYNTMRQNIKLSNTVYNLLSGVDRIDYKHKNLAEITRLANEISLLFEDN